MSQSTAQRRVMLISNSYCFGRGYLEHCAAAIRSFLGTLTHVAFVPYALQDWDRYTATVRETLGKLGIDVIGVHNFRPLKLAQAQAVFVGGGNTFRLLHTLYTMNSLSVIREAVGSGVPYIGASAGANLAGPTIKTTNDMPIVQPPSFDALGIVPFQINPHFIDADPSSKHMGETREKRIAEFHEEPENSAMVIGIREGSWITVEGSVATLFGTTGAKIFIQGEASREWDGGHLTVE
ncbi:MAG: dipeptidase PepE [Candidatus Kerfeldbacteria bacterium]|nr:dipeptidase PepE [Candidatus Kerfeldbacteria bacterium]